MKRNFIGLLMSVIVVCALSVMVFGQGKGKGNSGSKGKGNSGSTVGDVTRNDAGRNPSDHGNGKSKKNDPAAGILAGHNTANGSSNRFKGLSKKTGTSAGALQTRYEIEKRLNPDLTYGQFVAAHMIARKHNGISTEGILGGLRSGKSIGQVLHDDGWDKGKIDKERKRIKKDRDKDRDKDYDDDEQTWRLPH